MPNKDGSKGAQSDNKCHGASSETTVSQLKLSAAASSNAPSVKSDNLATMSPGPAPIPPQPPPPPPPLKDAELLGSLTTQQQQRTSARVIKKLRQDTEATGQALNEKTGETEPDRADFASHGPRSEKDSLKESASTEIARNVVKQRMPKALWSFDEKRVFFEALNEYGKDFDAITAHIGSKMKKKGSMGPVSKTKNQVSHLYYRTWHKISKYLKCFDNVKKVPQELYALINYGELRKKFFSLNEKTSGKLSELIVKGTVAFKFKGKTLRIRTPMCRALRRLNQLEDYSEQVRLPTRAIVSLNARDTSVWVRVQSMSHNPRVKVPCALTTQLRSLIKALEIKWTGASGNIISHDTQNTLRDEPVQAEELNHQSEVGSQTVAGNIKDDDEIETTILIANVRSLEKKSHLLSKAVPENLETRMIVVAEDVTGNKLALHMGPKPGVEIHLPMVSLTEPLTSQKICFSSYQERMRKLSNQKGSSGSKLRHQKRIRKDSGADNLDVKRLKAEDAKVENCDNIFKKLADIDETAVDGIELMASMTDGKNVTDLVNGSSTIINEIVSPLRIEEKLNGCGDILDDDKDKEHCSDADDENKIPESENEASFLTKFRKDQIISNKKIKIKIQQKSEAKEKSAEPSIETNGVYPSNDNEDIITKVPGICAKEVMKECDVEVIMKQVRRGWSVYDTGNLTIGDLYLMFGSDSKLELDYWWAEPSPPLSTSLLQQLRKVPESQIGMTSNADSADVLDHNVDSLAEKEKERESDCELFSPNSNDGLSGDEKKESSSPDQKQKQKPESKYFHIVSKLVNNPEPNYGTNEGPYIPSDREREQIETLTARLRKLLSLSLLYGKRNRPSCPCGHVCGSSRNKKASIINTARRSQEVTPSTEINDRTSASHRKDLPSDHPGNRMYRIHKLGQKDPFRIPPPLISPDTSQELNFDMLPPWTRRRGRVRNKSNVPQRNMPVILPKPYFRIVDPNSFLTEPVKKSNTLSRFPIVATKILPKSVSPTESVTYISNPNMEPNTSYQSSNNVVTPEIAAVNQQDNVIIQDQPADNILVFGAVVQTPDAIMTNTVTENTQNESGSFVQCADGSRLTNFMDITLPSNIGEESIGALDVKDAKNNTQMFSGLLHTESMSMSPSRLLNDQWLDPDVHDFSLSSFLGHLEAVPMGGGSIATKSAEDTPIKATSSHRNVKDSASSATAGNLGTSGTEEVMDTQLQCLMSETSIDYMAKFADLAAEVAAENNKN